MIILIVGGIGSGKSCSAVRTMLRSKYHTFTNMNVRLPNATRMYKEDIIMTSYEGKNRKLDVNWDFWNKAKEKHENFNICLDETNNLFSPRKSLSLWNQKAIEWVSQIRKQLGDSEKTHLILVTQKLKRLDVGFRDLLHVIVDCRKHQTGHKVETVILDSGRLRKIMIPETYIELKYFFGKNVEERYRARDLSKSWNSRIMFYANPIFKYYDSYQIFGESAYL